MDPTVHTPTNDVDALTTALVLAITAPSDEQTRRAVALADNLAARLTAEEIKAAKAAALEVLS